MTRLFSCIFILPPVIFYGIYANRLSIYTMLFVFLLVVLWLDSIEGNKARPIKIAMLLMISGILSCWRSEGIWLVLFVPWLMLLAYKYKQIGKNYFFLLFLIVIIRFIISIPQNINTVWTDANYNHGRMAPFYEYTITTMEYVGLDDQKNEKYIEDIDRYLDWEKVQQLCGTMGDSVFKEVLFEATRPDTTRDDYVAFTNAVEKVIYDNPIIFVKTKFAVFNFTALNQNPFVGTCKAEQVNGNIGLMGENAGKHLFMSSSTPTIIRYLFNIIFSGVNLPMKGNIARIISMILRLPYNLYIPAFILFASGIRALYKRNAFEIVLIIGTLIHGGIVFIMAPAAYFMYYYPLYLLGYLIAGVKILNYKKCGDI